MLFTGLCVLSSISLYDSVENVIICPQNCGKSYKNISSLNKHLKYECNKIPQFKCLFCDKKAKRPDNLRKHMKLVHGYNESTNYRYNTHTQNGSSLDVVKVINYIK